MRVSRTSPAIDVIVDPVGKLYRDHHTWLQGWLRSKIGCPHNAADLAHDTFMRVVKARNAEEIHEPRAYLTTIAHGLMVNQFRRQEIERAYLDVLASRQEVTVPSPEERAIVIESLIAIDLMLDALPGKVRLAFLLFQLEGLSHAEIAERLKVSISSVRQYIAKAMQHCLLCS